MEKCKHGHDRACLICGFGEFEGKRVFFEWKYEQLYSSFTKLHNTRITAPERSIKLALEAINNEIALCKKTETNWEFPLSQRNQAFVIRETLLKIQEILKGELPEVVNEAMIQVGSRVFVDFYSSNMAETDGKHIHGYGIVDGLDQNDTFVFGRLDKGGFFGCPIGDIQLVESSVPEAILEAESRRNQLAIK
ncbi:hypothetical protein SLK20_01175 [Acinetobacter pittii]|uniref:hypothetical protein n=1 Tax=Acinetobacter pittii TaxID=48296 RepID=UPI002A01DEE5|nr:hypothetical protein [Acinetobacter pittii]MDX8157809.1 hypothetical protein [Acinetobacter pittii]